MRQGSTNNWYYVKLNTKFVVDCYGFLNSLQSDISYSYVSGGNVLEFQINYNKRSYIVCDFDEIFVRFETLPQIMEELDCDFA